MVLNVVIMIFCGILINADYPLAQGWGTYSCYHAGRMNRALSLAGRKIKTFRLKILLFI